MSDEADVTTGERLAVGLQHLLPQRLLTELAGAFARSEAGALTTFAVRRFIQRYDVQMRDAEVEDPAAYRSFNAFFTRALKPGIRPLADADWISPADGAVSQLGAIDGDWIVQAKGRGYTAQALLGGAAEAAEAARYRGGSFCTIYLSPRDYHRLHMPCAGRLRRMLHVPGPLFSVNPATARGVAGVFARNERVVCHFDDPQGRPFALVLVGATIVGGIETVWHGVVNASRGGVVRGWDYPEPGRPPVELARGAEMGRFLLGSTIVVLLPPGPLAFDPALGPAAPIRMGQALARRA